jgi:hypothetical protein
MKTSFLIKCALIAAILPLYAGCVQREVVYRDRPAPAPPPPPAAGVVVEDEAPPPPPPQVEAVPVIPGPPALWFWAPGVWEWHGRWVWTRGHWMNRPHAGAVWYGAHWERRGGHRVWIGGAWR